MDLTMGTRNNSAALIYICVHCGVKFSSPSTLEAHMMFYCHKRPQEGTTSTATQSSKQMSPAKPTSPQIHSSPQKPGSVPAAVHPESSSQGHKETSPEKMDIIKIEPKTPSPPMTPVNQDRSISMAMQRSPKKRDYSQIAEGKDSTEMSPQKIPRIEQLIRCPNCPFATDSQAVFEAHMLEHSPGMSGFNGNFLCEDVTYCKECNIQFSSKKTFNGHKEFYCEKRRRKPSQSSRSPASHESPKMMSPPATQPIRISPMGPGSSIRPNNNLPTIPVPMVPAPGLVVTNGLIQQSPTVVLAAPIITQQPLTNGGPLNVPTVIMQPVISLPDPAHAHHVTSTGRTAQNRNNTEEKPLDLTVKRESRENKPDTPASLKIREKTPSPVRSSPEKRESVPVWKDRSPVHAGPPALVRCPSSPLQGPPVSKVSGSHEKAAVPPMSTECHNCKIKFSSVEIYLIHKKHYCRGSSIKFKDEESPRRSPMATTVSALNGLYPVMLPGLSSSSGPLVPPTPSMLYQSFFRYYCMHCKIKFSSTSTLQAHQNFYCPMRKMNEPEMSNTSSSDSSQKPVRSPVQEERSPPSHVCQYCHIELSTAQHLAAHQKACAESTAKISHLPCLYCSFIAYNETALAEHVKTHVPTKSYMCRLCGYRGNTMRGMRMHAKVHVDSAETFTDDCILVLSDDGVPIQDHNGPSIGNGVSIAHYREKDIPHREAESIPSSHWLKERKDSRSPERHMCIICGAVFASQSMLEQHVVVHKKDREVFQCKLCRFESHEQSQLIEHMKLVHRQTPTHETDSNEETKISVDETSNQEQPLSPGEIRRTDYPKNSDSFVADHFSVSSETKENLSVSTVRVKQEVKDSDSGDASQSPKSNENLPPNERMFKPLPVGPVAPLSPVMSHNVSVSDSSGSLQSNKCEKVGAKYCKQCDITFTYLSTFIAHKKYYCTANSAEKAAT